MKKTTWVFFFYKYGKFWSVLLDKKVDLKPLFSEECKEKFGLCFSLELLIKSSRNLTIHTIRTENNTSRHSSEHLVTSKEDLQLDRITQWPITTIFNLSWLDESHPIYTIYYSFSIFIVNFYVIPPSGFWLVLVQI